MRNISILVLVVTTLACGSATAQVTPPAPGACDPQAYMRALGEGRWTQAYSSGMVSPNVLMSFDHYLALTDAFIRERRGSVADARNRYARIGEAGRSAVRALGASGDNEAR